MLCIILNIKYQRVNQPFPFGGATVVDGSMGEKTLLTQQANHTRSPDMRITDMVVVY